MKYTLNSDLERACRRASDETIVAVHEAIHDAMTAAQLQHPMDDAQFILFSIATRGVLDHLERHIRHRDLLSAESDRRHHDRQDSELESFLEHIRESDDEHFEEHYYQAKRAYLQAVRIDQVGERLSRADQVRSRQALAAWPALEAEVERRGIREKMQRNQDLRNANFRAEDAEKNPVIQMMLNGWITSIPGHQFQERLDQCLRDVEVAMEVGEADLIWRERLYLDRLREYIEQHGIVVEDTGK